MAAARPQPLAAAARGLGLALTLAAAVASALAAPANRTESLYAASAAARQQAQQWWLQPAERDLAPLDPRASGCLNGATAPHCSGYGRFLASVVQILAARARMEQAQQAERRPARDLLWSLLHDPAADPFDAALPGLGSDAKAAALRSQAQQALRAAMALPTRPSLAAASAAAVASASDASHAWFILRACAGQTQLAGCRYGSYLFATDGRLLASRSLEVGAADNPGAGVDEWHATLKPGHRLPRRGLLASRGGFGGDLDRLVLHSLGPQGRALCGLSVPQTTPPAALAAVVARFDSGAGDCRWPDLPAGAQRLNIQRVR